MTKLFSDYYSVRDNFLTRLDARLKLLFALIVMGAIILSNNPALPWIFFFLSLWTMFLIGLPRRAIIGRLSGPLGFALVVFVLQSFLAGKTPLYNFQLFGFAFVVKSEGVRLGIVTASRMAGSVALFVLLAFVTPAHKLFAGLRSLGVPSLWVEISALMYRGVFVLLESFGEMYNAQKVRLGFSGKMRGMQTGGTLAGAVIIRAAEKSASTHEAMLARGYTGSMPYAPLPPLGKRDYLRYAGALIFLSALFFVLEIGS
ncbi:MAG: cobalt ECF transporter T component CbiQ [Nitrospinae bacterium]|nr:cobalt ECF transporter T component CbiQ [Nitrospinota bacterium]